MSGNSFEPFCSRRVSIDTLGGHSEGLLSPNSRASGASDAEAGAASLLMNKEAGQYVRQYLLAAVAGAAAVAGSDSAGMGAGLCLGGRADSVVAEGSDCGRDLR